MFEVNDMLKNKHTGCIVKVNNVITVGKAKLNPVYCVEYVESEWTGGVNFRFNSDYAKHWYFHEIVGDEEE